MPLASVPAPNIQSLLRFKSVGETVVRMNSSSVRNDGCCGVFRCLASGEFTTVLDKFYAQHWQSWPTDHTRLWPNKPPLEVGRVDTATVRTLQFWRGPRRDL